MGSITVARRPNSRPYNSKIAFKNACDLRRCLLFYYTVSINYRDKITDIRVKQDQPVFIHKTDFLVGTVIK